MPLLRCRWCPLADRLIGSRGGDGWQQVPPHVTHHFGCPRLVIANRWALFVELPFNHGIGDGGMRLQWTLGEQYFMYFMNYNPRTSDFCLLLVKQNILGLTRSKAVNKCSEWPLYVIMTILIAIGSWIWVWWMKAALTCQKQFLTVNNSKLVKRCTGLFLKSSLLWLATSQVYHYLSLTKGTNNTTG